MRLNLGKLFLSIIIDLIGVIPTILKWLATPFPSLESSVLGFLIPIAELMDIVWAPVSAAMVQMMYGNLFWTFIQLGEEILPGPDIIPTATIAWWWYTFKRKPKVGYGGKTPNQPIDINSFCKSRYAIKEDIDECIRRNM